MDMNISVPNFSKVVAAMKDLNKDVNKAISMTISDVKARAPAQITKAVTSVYGIKSAEVTAAGKDAKLGSKTVGSIKVKGVHVDSVQLIYKGRVLTPTHFSMTPRTRPSGGRKYTVKAAIYKGKKKSLGTGVFLAPTGGTQIPFKRAGKKRLPIDAVKTVSIPQMLMNDVVAPDIQTRLDELLATRMEHHAQRIASKK